MKKVESEQNGGDTEREREEGRRKKVSPEWL